MSDIADVLAVLHDPQARLERSDAALRNAHHPTPTAGYRIRSSMTFVRRALPMPAMRITWT